MIHTPPVLEYGRSFVQATGYGTRNSPRFWVESWTRVSRSASPADLSFNESAELYYQCGACKSERTFVDRGILTEDNHEFTPVFGTKNTVVFRRKCDDHGLYRTVTPTNIPWDVEPRVVAARSPLSKRSSQGTKHFQGNSMRAKRFCYRKKQFDSNIAQTPKDYYVEVPHE